MQLKNLFPTTHSPLMQVKNLLPTTCHLLQLKNMLTTTPLIQPKKQLTSSPKTDPYPHLCPISLLLFLPHPPLEVTLPLKFTPSSFSLPPLHNLCTLLLHYPKKARVPSMEQAILLIPPKKYQYVGHLITRRMMFPSSRIISKKPLHSNLPHLATSCPLAVW